MGLLPQPQPKKLILPSSESLPADQQEWIEVNANPLGGDIAKFLAASSDMDDADKNMALVASLITSWSFQNEDGTPAAITAENVGHLKIEDLNFVVLEVGVLIGDGGSTLPEKKDETSAKSSPQSATTHPEP